jgi:class 3 adenylate cyclase
MLVSLPRDSLGRRRPVNLVWSLATYGISAATKHRLGAAMAETKEERRLTTIMAADVVGYSRLVEVDETGTLAALKSLRQTVLEPLLNEHRGRLVKLMGDGLLAELGSVVGAVACAKAIQIRLTAIQEKIPPERQIVLSIGINLGDVVVEGDDLLGNGVNVAARLEQICPPGSVLISERPMTSRIEYAGKQRLKNFARPVRAYRMVLDGTSSSEVAGLRLADKPAVAVLPFENMSGDPEPVYFSDGITEDIITELSRFRDLMVIARNTSFSFLGKSMDVHEIGRVLGAGTWSRAASVAPEVACASRPSSWRPRLRMSRFGTARKYDHGRLAADKQTLNAFHAPRGSSASAAQSLFGGADTSRLRHAPNASSAAFCSAREKPRSRYCWPQADVRRSTAKPDASAMSTQGSRSAEWSHGAQAAAPNEPLSREEQRDKPLDCLCP